MEHLIARGSSRGAFGRNEMLTMSAEMNCSHKERKMKLATQLLYVFVFRAYCTMTLASIDDVESSIAETF